MAGSGCRVFPRSENFERSQRLSCAFDPVKSASVTNNGAGTKPLIGDTILSSSISHARLHEWTNHDGNRSSCPWNDVTSIGAVPGRKLTDVWISIRSRLLIDVIFCARPDYFELLVTVAWNMPSHFSNGSKRLMKAIFGLGLVSIQFLNINKKVRFKSKMKWKIILCMKAHPHSSKMVRRSNSQYRAHVYCGVGVGL